jgi:hypothetical protein
VLGRRLALVKRGYLSARAAADVVATAVTTSHHPGLPCSMSGAQVTWGEVGGAVGDLGTFVPLLVGLAVTHRLDVGSTLAFTGIYNIVTGARMHASIAHHHPFFLKP